MALRKEILDDYINVAITNLQAISRAAADGNIDISTTDGVIPESCKHIFDLHAITNIPQLCMEEFNKFNFSKSQLDDLQKSNNKIAALDIHTLHKMSRDAIKLKIIDNFIKCMKYVFNYALSRPPFKSYCQIK